MAFASIHIPDFLIQALVRTDPALRNRAIALVDGTPPLWKVIAASEAALRAGIQMGMAKSQAAQFCDLEIRHRSPAQERAAHAALLDLGWSMSPRIEGTAPHTIVADVTGLASLFGSVANIAREFVARAARLGLFANVAIASNIEAALLASRGFAGITLIAPGEEVQQLGDLPVETLPAAPETLEILDRWGVRTCAALAALPLLDLSERLGQEGVRLHELARGANNRSLVLAQTSLTFEEEMALDDSVEELEPLSFILGRLLDQLCARLNARALAIQSIRVRFELEPAFENGIERLKDEPSRPGAQKPAAKTYEKSLSLPVPMRDSKTLLKLLRLHLQSVPPGAPILKVAISAEPAAPRSAQGGLFVPVSPDPEKLELTVARLAHLVGDANVGSPELVDTHRPGGFRLARFCPANPAAESQGHLQSASRKRNKKATTAIRSQAETNDASPATETKRRPLTAFRAFRPAPPAKIDLHNSRPARVAFNGQLASVITASGPWRTSGDWWREDTWQHDEWDLELRFEPIRETTQKSDRRTRIAVANLAPQIPPNGVYCLYFDAARQTWFVRGVYD
jgi:protein ImuB